MTTHTRESLEKMSDRELADIATVAAFARAVTVFADAPIIEYDLPMGRARLERATSQLAAECSIQLSYRP